MVLYSQRDQHAALRTLEEMILNEDEEVTLQ
jgi:hypothetical protein